MKYSLFGCIAGVLYCMYQSYDLNSQAKSVMHQMYAAQYDMMGVIYLCCAFILFGLLEIKKSKAQEKEPQIKLEKKKK